VLFPLGVSLLEALYPVLYRSLEGQVVVLTTVRFLMAFALLVPATFLMGATLPAMAEAAARSGPWAKRVSALYATNTLGGVVGTIATGFVLLERLGSVSTLYVGALGSVLLGLAAFALGRHPAYRAEPPTAAPAPCRTETELTAEAALWSVAFSAALVAGLTSLAAELVWTRALVFYVHNSTYAFSAIVAVYLLGIASGAALVARVQRTPKRALRILGLTLAAACLALVVAIAAYRNVPELAGLLVRVSGFGGSAPADATTLPVASWASALFLIFGLVAAVLFLPALLLGAAFPLCLGLVGSGDESAARTVGRLYATNAMGSVLGVLLGTFALVPLFGTRGALLALAWIPAPIALWALVRADAAKREGASNHTRTVQGAVFVGALAVFSLVAAPSGFYRALFEKRFGSVLWFSEGVSETVAVCEYRDKSRWIQFSDGRGASGTQSFQGGWLYAHLPLLLHPRPKTAAVVCFGTGNTLGAASLHPLERLDGVELSTEVVKASAFFADTNHAVAANPRVHVEIEDGRSYMLASDRRYDVITEEPPLVHTAGVVNLYSRDFYELCSRRLTDDGILAVWLATWELEEPEVQMLLRAFVDVFPYATAWDCTHPFEWLLIGSKRPIAIDLDELGRRMADPRLSRDLLAIEPQYGGIRTPADLLSLYLRGPQSLVEMAGSAAPVTDDRSVVDFTAPRRARANFGLGEWVTGGLNPMGMGGRDQRLEPRLRTFDRIYSLRESASSLVAHHGATDRGRFETELADRVFLREMRAAQVILGDVRRLAAALRAEGLRLESLAAVDRGLQMVRRDFAGPLLAMKGQLLQELGREGEAGVVLAAGAEVDDSLKRRSAAMRLTSASTPDARPTSSTPAAGERR